MKAESATTRRRFFWSAGAVLSAPLAAAAAHGTQSTDEDSDALKARLALLEDVNAIRELNQAYAKHVNAGAHEELANLFADAADVPVYGGIRAVSADHFDPDGIEIAADRRTATARIPCTAQVETPIEPACPLVEMARQQGGGVFRRSENGVLESRYVKRDGTWKIERLTHRQV